MYFHEVGTRLNGTLRDQLRHAVPYCAIILFRRIMFDMQTYINICSTPSPRSRSTESRLTATTSRQLIYISQQISLIGYLSLGPVLGDFQRKVGRWRYNCDGLTMNSRYPLRFVTRSLGFRTEPSKTFNATRSRTNSSVFRDQFRISTLARFTHPDTQQYCAIAHDRVRPCLFRVSHENSEHRQIIKILLKNKTFFWN